MNIRTAFATSLVAIFLAAPSAPFAAAESIHLPVHAIFSKSQKQIKFSVSNETGAPLELKIGDQVSTLEAGKIMKMKLPVGTRIVANNATEHHHVGDVLVEVSDAYSDTNVAIKN